MKLMLERGIDADTVEAVTWGNAIAAYGQSGQFTEEELLTTPGIDQSELFADNSVLRGQAPRVEGPIPN